MVSRVQISLPLLKKNLADARFFFYASSEKKSGIRKELLVMDSVGVWNLPVVDFGGAWVAGEGERVCLAGVG